MSKRIKTNYPGVFYREAQRITGPGMERVYYVVFKKAGKVLEEKVGRQYVDAMTPARAARIRAERIEGKRLSKKQEREKAKREAETIKWTIDRLWEEYKSQRAETKGLSIDEYRYKKYLKPNFEKTEPKDLSQFEVDKLRLKTMKVLSDQSKRHVLALLRRIINFGVRKNLCEPLLFTLEMPSVENQKTEDLTDKQLAALLKAIDEEKNVQIANLMRMALLTGMRRGELFRLQWRDINFHRGFINIRNPKGGQDQRIPLNDAARNLLKNHIRTESEFVFPGRGGQQRTTISASANDIKTKAGLPKDFRPLHGLRHVYASMLASSGQVDMYTLQKLLTHKSPIMTQRYAHLRDSALRNAANLAGTLIEKIATKGKKDAEKKTQKN